MDEIDEFLDSRLVDAYGDSEQLVSLEVAFHDAVRFPFPARVVGAPVEVLSVAYEGDERRGLTAICRRDGAQHRVGLAELVPGPVSLKTMRVFNAYRRWMGMPSLQPEVGQDASRVWTYEPVASRNISLTKPLLLNPTGTWNPVNKYWGEEGDELDPLTEQIIAAGPRPEFEMEQVIPGIDDDDWDSDPIVDAADMHRAGYEKDAIRILKDLIAQDVRCVDAWAHLGNFASHTQGPKAAIEFYDTAIAIAEQSLPDDFGGVLPWGLIDNRPFHRALYGLGLCAWRQRRWEHAETIFTNRVWLEGCGTIDALWCLGQIRARQRWRND